MNNKVWDYVSNDNDLLAEKVKKDGNIVMTNPTMAKDLIARICFADGDIIMEACKGTGSFYDNLPSNTINKYCEINEGIDYLSFDGIVDYTISNPPFVPRKLFWSFHCKAMDTTRKEIYWLVNLASLNTFTPKRLQEMKDKGWLINSFHIVSDKRWFGRYAWVKISKNNTDVMSWYKKSY